MSGHCSRAAWSASSTLSSVHSCAGARGVQIRMRRATRRVAPISGCACMQQMRTSDMWAVLHRAWRAGDGGCGRGQGSPQSCAGELLPSPLPSSRASLRMLLGAGRSGHAHGSAVQQASMSAPRRRPSCGRVPATLASTSRTLRQAANHTKHSAEGHARAGSSMRAVAHALQREARPPSADAASSTTAAAANPAPGLAMRGRAGP